MRATALPDIAIRRWTRAEYDRLIDLGVFQPGERLELLDGWLVLREPQGTEHSAAIRHVLDVLRQALGETWRIDSAAAHRRGRRVRARARRLRGCQGSQELSGCASGAPAVDETLRPPATMAPLLTPERPIAVAALLP